MEEVYPQLVVEWIWVECVKDVMKTAEMMKDFKFLKSEQKHRLFTDFMDAMDDYHLGGIPFPTTHTGGNAFSYLIYPRQESEVRLPFIWLANDISTGEYRLDRYAGPIKYFRTWYINLSDSLYRDETATRYLPTTARIHSIEIDDYSIPELSDWEFISEDTIVQIFFKLYTLR